MPETHTSLRLEAQVVGEWEVEMQEQSVGEQEVEQSSVKLERRARGLYAADVDRRHDMAAIVQCGSFIVDVL